MGVACLPRISAWSHIGVYIRANRYIRSSFLRPPIILRIGITTASTKQLEKSGLGCENSEVEVLVVTVPKKLKKGKNLCLPRQHKTILHPVFPDATATTRTIMASRAVAAAPAENGSLSVIHPTVT